MNKYFKKLYDTLCDNKDVIIREDKELEAVFFYQEQMCNIALFNKDYLPLLKENKEKSFDEVLLGICREYKKRENVDFFFGMYQIIFMGLMICYSKKEKKFYLFDISKSPSRQTSDSLSEPESVFGPRDGFVENFKDNIALIRTRLKSSNMEMDEYMVGRRSKTVVNILSIKDIHDQALRKEINNKIASIDIDAVLEMADVVSPFQNKRKIPSFAYLGSPDLAVRHLLNGEFLIVVDRITSVISLPVNITSFTRQRIETTMIRGFTLLERCFVLISLFISVTFLAIFASLITSQSDSLSLLVLATLKNTGERVMFPPYFQIYFVLLLFELYFIVGFKSSRVTLSSMIVLIGGILIGQNTIQSGIVGVVIMTLTALAFLTSFAVTSNVTLIFAISIARIFLLICSMLYGIYGLIIGFMIMLASLYKEKTLGVYFLSPFIPLDFKDIKGFFLPDARKEKYLRPNSFNTVDKTFKNHEKNN